MKIPIANIISNPQQPRTLFDKEELQTLADSLQNDGLLNPIAVEGPSETGIYTLLDGERRLRAAQLAGWTEIEANVARPSLNGSGELERLCLAMVANLQREDMGPVDEAKAYKKLTELGLTQVEIARRVGRSDGNISSKMKLLNFPPSVQKLVNDKRLPLDECLFKALRKLDFNKQEQITKIAATRKLATASIISLCYRMSKESRPTYKPGPKAKYKIPDSDCPPLTDVTLAAQYAGAIPAIKETCAQCELYADGGVRTICPTCPMMMFVKLLERKPE